MSVRLSPSVRISIGLACLALTVLIAAAFLGFVRDHDSTLLQSRKELCEAIAIHCSAAAQRKDVSLIAETLGTIVRRDPAILSAGVRDADGKLIVEAGDRRANRRPHVANGRFIPEDEKK